MRHRVLCVMQAGWPSGAREDQARGWGSGGGGWRDVRHAVRVDSLLHQWAWRAVWEERSSNHVETAAQLLWSDQRTVNTVFFFVPSVDKEVKFTYDYCVLVLPVAVMKLCQHSYANMWYGYSNSVCLSVHPSVTLRNCIETAWHIIILSSAYDNAMFVAFPVLNFFAKFSCSSFNAGGWGGVYNLRDFLSNRPRTNRATNVSPHEKLYWIYTCGAAHFRVATTSGT